MHVKFYLYVYEKKIKAKQRKLYCVLQTDHGNVFLSFAYISLLPIIKFTDTKPMTHKTVFLNMNNIKLKMSQKYNFVDVFDIHSQVGIFYSLQVDIVHYK